MYDLHNLLVKLPPVTTKQLSARSVIRQIQARSNFFIIRLNCVNILQHKRNDHQYSIGKKGVLIANNFLNMSTPQILRAKGEVESSLATAISLRDRWLVATNDNPTNLTKKEIDNIGKAFKNRLLTLKWDCEDLEELVSASGENEVEIKNFINHCRNEISKFMSQLEEADSSSKIFNKHGITLTNSSQEIAKPIATTTAVASIIQNPLSQYERLSELDAGEIHFDKSQIEASTTIFNNALYDHYDHDADESSKGVSATQVFNNITRPTTDVYMHPNENEMILEMLETEYYNPPSKLLSKTRYNQTISKFIDTDRYKILGKYIALLFAFPIMLVLFFVI